MATTLYWLTAHTNLHVGSGDTNYGVIDNLVQRDVLTELPTIHESGLKGALKEYCTHEIKKTKRITDTEIAHKEAEIKKNFGNSDDSGDLKFFGAYLLTFPVRTNVEMFLPATCPSLLKDFLKYAQLLGVTLPSEITTLIGIVPAINQPKVFNNNLAGRKIEYRSIQTVLNQGASPTIPAFLGGSSLVLLNDSDAKKIIGPNKLPVIARNSLKDGQSENLWYEEIVPRQSKFYFFVQDNALANSQFSWFDIKITNASIQVGGNASIGQGLCKIEKF